MREGRNALLASLPCTAGSAGAENPPERESWAAALRGNRPGHQAVLGILDWRETGDRTQCGNWKLKASVLLEKRVEPSEAVVRRCVNADNTELIPLALLQGLPAGSTQVCWKEASRTHRPGVQVMLVMASAHPVVPSHSKISSGSSHGHSQEEFLSREHSVLHLSSQDLLPPTAKSKGDPQCLSLTGRLLPWTKGERVCGSLLEHWQHAAVCAAQCTEDE